MPDAEDFSRQVRSEPRDVEWAEHIEQLFGEDLRTKATEFDFHVRSVECRTTSCVADLNFPNLAKAKSDFKGILGGPNRAGCHERLLFAPDAKDDAPTLGVFILDCGEVRQREAVAKSLKEKGR